MKKLWQKDWKLDPFIEAFETKGDLLMDQKLVKFDILGSIAHAKMLNQIGILSDDEFMKAKEGLTKIIKLSNLGKFKLESGDEDIHTKIEDFLTKNHGEVGKKIHTGRSRNDQVLTDLRLFTKEQMLLIWKELLFLIGSFSRFAKKYEYVPMSGYTHMQKAMPSSVGMWASSFSEAFLDDLLVLKIAYNLNDQSPLGSAAGYGVPLPLDRELTAELLGFSKVQANSLYCQNSRGKIEGVVLSSLIPILSDICKFASDILIFTTAEFNYFKVADKLCTGSSIMPQKKNVDIAELLRSKVHLLAGNYLQIVSLSGNLISGYNRDFQDTKKPLIESLELALDSIKVANILINNISPQKEVLKKAMTPEVFATHKALELSLKGVPFRKAYQAIKQGGKDLSVKDLVEVIARSKHIGGTGNLGLAETSENLKKEKKKFIKEEQSYDRTVKSLLE